MSVIEKGAVKRDKQRILKNQQIKAQHELCMEVQRERIMKIENVITPKELKKKVLQEIGAIKTKILDEFVARIQREPEESKTLFEKTCKDKHETAAVIKILFEKRLPLRRELDKTEDVLNRYIWYSTISFKLLPSKWQKAQEEAQDGQKEQKSDPEGTAVSKGMETGCAPCPEGTVSSIVDSIMPSCPNDTVDTEPDVERGGDENEEKLEIYFSDPQQVMDLLMELTDQVLSLIHNSTEVDKMLEETIEITINKMKEDEEKLIRQVNDMMNRIKGEDKRTAMLKRMVQFYDSLKTEDQDVLLTSLRKKVRGVYSSGADSNLTNLSTLEKLCSIEHRMIVLLQQIENIPEDMCKALWQIKDNERKSRLREEKLRLEREKQRVKFIKCMQRAHGDTKRVTGRMLRPRSRPVKQKIITTEEPVAATVEDVPYEDFFSGL